jgi:gluconokinase
MPSVLPAWAWWCRVLRSGRSIANACARKVQFILLDGPRDLISKRMLGRKGHFMPQSLLDSQLATLEKPGPGEDAVILDISHNVPTLLVEAVQSVGR